MCRIYGSRVRCCYRTKHRGQMIPLGAARWTPAGHVAFGGRGNMTICQFCNATLRWVPGLGWRHPGGALIIRRCTVCRETTEEPYGTGDQCPRCGQQLLDDHCATPVEET